MGSAGEERGAVNKLTEFVDSPPNYGFIRYPLLHKNFPFARIEIGSLLQP